jgi:hypothetical protein
MDHVAERCHRVLEPLHAMINFAPELQERMTGIGLKRGRMCALASRVAPLGAVTLGALSGVFYTFNPELIARLVPPAWTLARPEDIVATRFEVADAALRRLLGPDVIGSPELAEAAGLAREAAEGCVADGRPVYAAHAALDWPAEPHVALWHAVTLLREFRGDGHLAVLVGHALDGLPALITHTATGGGFAVPAAKKLRGWSDEQWAEGVERLRRDGLLDGDDQLTKQGLALREEIEHDTNRLAERPWLRLGDEKAGRLHDLGRKLTRRVIAAGAFPAGIFADPHFTT